MIFVKARTRLVTLAAFAALAASAFADPPSVRNVTTPAVSPSAAWAYYGSSVTHTNGIGAWTDCPTPGQAGPANMKCPPELIALARTLGSERLAASKITANDYAQNVFDYVRNNIDTEFRFGLGKGARGAVIDQSGTSFDQAQLMVQLLRLGGVSASYQVGTITLDAQQFGQWTGLVSSLVEASPPNLPTISVNAKVACQFIADGGIPVVVNGSSDCASLSGNLSSITLGQAWVLTNGKAYDPAFKRYNLRAGIDVAAAMQCGSDASPTCAGTIKTAALSGAVQSAIGGGSAVRDLNSGATGAQIEAWTTNLQNQILSSRAGAVIEEIIGGRRFDVSYQPVPATALPYASTVQYSWSGDIPDQFRSRIEIRLNGQAMPFYGDEIDGKRFYVRNVEGSYPSIYLEDQSIGACINGGTPATASTLAAVFPYRFGSDASTEQSVFFSCGNGHIAAFWGNVGEHRPEFFADLAVAHPVLDYGLVQLMGYAAAPCGNGMTARDWYDYVKMQAYAACMTGGTDTTPLPYTIQASDISTEQHPAMLSRWMQQWAMATKIVDGLNKTRTEHHVSLGGTFVIASRVSSNVVSLTSVSSATDVASKRSSSFETNAALGSMMEGSVFQQTAQSWRPSSGVANLEFGQQEQRGGDIVLVNDSNVASVKPGLLNYDAYELQLIDTRIGEGYSLLIPKNRHFGRVFLSQNQCYYCVSLWDQSPFGMLAFKDGSIAYLVDFYLKGASGSLGAENPLTAATAAIKKEAKALHGLDASISLASGELSLSPESDLVTGEGAFPKSLPFSRTYSSTSGAGIQMSDQLFLPSGVTSVSVPWFTSSSGAGSQVGAQLGGGWTHNYAISASISSSGSLGLGGRQGVEASYAIAAIKTLTQLLENPDFQARVSAIVTANWLAQTFIDNTVTVTFPNMSDAGVRGAGGRYFSTPTSASKFEVTGARTGLYRVSDGYDSPVVYSYEGVEITYTNRSGEVLSFSPETKRDVTFGVPGSTQGSASFWMPEFVPDLWTFPNGMRVSFSYTSDWQGEPGLLWVTSASSSSSKTRRILSTVSNSLGRTLTINSELHSMPVIRRITSVKDETERQVTYTRSGCPNQTGPAYSAAGAVSALWLDCATFEVKKPDNSVEIYAYEATSASPDPAVRVRSNYKLRRIYAPSNHDTPYQTIAYDELMRVKSVTNQAQEKTDYLAGGVSNERWKRAQSISPLGNVSTSIFDRKGQLLTAIDPLGRTTRNEYDDAGRLTRSTQPAGNAEERTYDVRSNVTRICLLPKERWDQHCNTGPGAANDIISTASYLEGVNVVDCTNYVTCNKASSDTDPLGRVTDYTWNSSTGNITRIEAPAVGGQRPQTDFGYSSYSVSGTTISLLTSITEKRSASENLVTTFAYDSSNRYVLLSGTTDPGGLALTTTLAFDATGNLTSVDGPRTDVYDVVTYQWDKLRRPVIITMPDPDGSGGPLVAPRTITRFDADGLVNLQAELRDDGQWRAIVTERDVLGRPVKATRPKVLNLGVISTPAQLAAVPLQSVASNDNFAQIAYDADGRARVATDPEGRKVLTVYDAAGQATKLIRAWQGNADGSGGSADCAVAGTLQQCYQTNTFSSNGKLLSVASAKGFVTSYSYDGFDRSQRVTYPDASYTETLSYDKVGNALSSRNRAGQSFTFSYDALGRLERKAAVDRVETYGYDLLGLQTCAETWGGGSGAATCGSGSPITRTTQSWDAARRLASETQLALGVAKTVGYQYADKVNRTAIVWPDGWRAVYSYDPLNRLTAVAADTDANGSAETPLSSYAYTSLGQMSGATRGPGAGVTASALTWEPDGDLDTLTHSFSGEAAGWAYDYDKSAKLTSETKPAAFSWTPPVARTIAYNLGPLGSATEKLDQYASVNGQASTYDPNGNRTSLAGLTTTHDAENRLVAASKTGMSVAYIYDAAGRRAAKDFASGGSDMILLSAGDMEIAEYDGAGSLLRRYIPGVKVDDRVAMIEATGATSYYHPDRLGNVIAVTNSSGQVTDRYKYTPFGIEEPISLSGNLYRYTGRRLDPETGLYHYRARYYDPSDGAGSRFLETDPIGYKDQMNPYAYVGNDPVNGTDPTGLQVAGCPVCTKDDEAYWEDLKSLSPEQRAQVGMQRFTYGAIGVAVIVTAVVAPEVALAVASRAPTATRLAVVVSNAVVENPVSMGAATGAIGVKAYQSGAANKLHAAELVGDGLDIHHAPQSHIAQQIVPGYVRDAGPAIALPRAEHQAIPHLKGVVNGNVRDMLAHATKQLRNFTNASNEEIQNWLKFAKDHFGANEK